MKKAIAAVLVLLMAVPAFALPYCTTGCGTGGDERVSCCCSTPPLEDGAAGLYAPPCCPSGSSAIRGADKPAGIPTLPSEIFTAGEALALVASLLTAALPTPSTVRPLNFDYGEGRPPAIPLFLRNSVFLI